MENEFNVKESKRVVRLFAAASFLNDLGYYLIVTIWPIFVTSVLGASIAFLGLVDGLGDAIVSLSQAGSGFLSDKIRKRKVFIWVGYFFAFVSRVIYGLSTAPWQVIFGKVFDRGGKLRDTPRDAIVADVTSHKNRAEAFGVLRAADRGGAVTGLLASIILVGYLSYRELFFLAAIPSLIGSLVVLFLVRERISASSIARSFSFRFVSRDLKIFTILSLIFTLGAFSDSFYILATNRHGIALALVPLFFLMYLVFASLMAVPFGKLSDKIGRRPVFVIALTLFILLNLLFIFAKNHWLIFLAFIVYGIHTAAFEGNTKTIVAEFASREIRASVIGGYDMLVGLMALPASLIAGILWDRISYEAPFVFSLLMAVIALLIISFVQEPKSELR